MSHKLSFSLLFAVLTCGQITSAQIPRQGGCPNVNLQEGFKWLPFDGVWYEHSRYPILRELEIKCVYSDYTYRPNNTVEIKFSGFITVKKPVSSDITGKIMGPGVLLITFESGTQETHKILGTDYKSWAAIYSCHNIGKYGSESAWILTRKRNADEDTVRRAKEVMTKNEISTVSLQETC